MTDSLDSRDFRRILDQLPEIVSDRLAQLPHPEVMRIDREAFDHALKEGREELIDLIRSVVREELDAQVTTRNLETTSEQGILERMQEAMREAIIDATRPALVEALQRLAPDIRRAVGRDTSGQLEHASAWHESHDSAERALRASAPRPSINSSLEESLRAGDEYGKSRFHTGGAMPTEGTPLRAGDEYGKTLEDCKTRFQPGLKPVPLEGSPLTAAQETGAPWLHNIPGGEDGTKLPLARPGRWRDGDPMDDK